MAFDRRALGRGMVKRCARCGTGGIFRSYYRLYECCRSCGFRFEREEGEWTGALMVIMAFTELLFAIWFGVGLWLTWPDVPWTLLLVGGIVLNLVIPVLFYPWSQSVWIGLHYSFVPLDAAEEAAAIAVVAAEERTGTSSETGSAHRSDASASPEDGAGAG
jgi:uncharacterized protein (DUF983 family)